MVQWQDFSHNIRIWIRSVQKSINSLFNNLKFQSQLTVLLHPGKIKLHPQMEKDISVPMESHSD